MKKTMVWILALTLAFSALLSGCGDMRKPAGDKTTPSAAPQHTAMPDITTPDPQDGIVKDDDGIITENDSGNGSDGHTVTDPADQSGTATKKQAADAAGRADQ